MTLFYDRATLRNGMARITPEGYFVADALVARANNIQDYRASELGLTDRDPNDIIRVFRPEAEVFARDSLASASRLPITLDHPPAMLDARNYVQYSRGETGEEIMRDGEFMRVPIRVTDAQAVDSVQHERQEFSMGYTAEIVMDAGEYQGQAYDAKATNIRYNHLAACRAARGGPELRITDERPANNGVPAMPEIVMVDSVPVDVSNPETARTLVTNLVAARDTANAALEEATNTVAARDATIAERDAEIATLRDQAKPLTPAQLRDAGAAYARDRRIAELLGVDVTDEMDVPAMHKVAVTAKVGDASKGYTPEQYATSFAALAATVTDAGDDDGQANVNDAGNDPLRAGLRDGAGVPVNDERKAFQDARAARFERFETAHRGKPAAAAQ